MAPGEGQLGPLLLTASARAYSYWTPRVAWLSHGGGDGGALNRHSGCPGPSPGDDSQSFGHSGQNCLAGIHLPAGGRGRRSRGGRGRSLPIRGA